jgi:hypothetical protein
MALVEWAKRPSFPRKALACQRDSAIRRKEPPQVSIGERSRRAKK